jgi:hypothetical protein
MHRREQLEARLRSHGPLYQQNAKLTPGLGTKPAVCRRAPVHWKTFYLTRWIGALAPHFFQADFASGPRKDNSLQDVNASGHQRVVLGFLIPAVI